MGQAALVRVVVLISLLALKTRKNLTIQFAELWGFYFVAGGVGLFLAQRASQIAPQGWEFYAITGALFTSFAFSGLTWRDLFKHRT